MIYEVITKGGVRRKRVKAGNREAVAEMVTAVLLGKDLRLSDGSFFFMDAQHWYWIEKDEVEELR